LSDIFVFVAMVEEVCIASFVYFTQFVLCEATVRIFAAYVEHFAFCDRCNLSQWVIVLPQCCRRSGKCW